MFGSSFSHVVEDKTQLSLQCKMKDLGRVSRYLGVHIVHTHTRVNFMHQTGYTTHLLSECSLDVSLTGSISLQVEIIL